MDQYHQMHDTTAPSPRNNPLAQRLTREVEGEVLFDRFSRGRYSTDACPSYKLRSAQKSRPFKVI